MQEKPMLSLKPKHKHAIRKEVRQQNIRRQATRLPAISVVIIGLNVERFLLNSILSVLDANYPKEKLEIIYVDSGSTDKSLEIAGRFTEVKIIELDVPNPSAAKGRMAGFHAASNKIIQYIDADSYLHLNWMKEAVLFIKDDVGAVAGTLREREPRRNLYHRMADLEWNLRSSKSGWTTSEKETKTFGGNVLIRKEVLQDACGYDANLSAGEDLDLSYRVRQMGFRILRLNQPMASHDINLANFIQYFKRSKRSGYAYAQLALKHWKQSEKHIMQPIVRIFAGVLIPAILVFTGFFSGYPVVGVSFALIVAFRLLFKTAKFARIFNISLALGACYSLHLAFVIYPQFLGMVHGFWDVLLRKLKKINLKRKWRESTRSILALTKSIQSK